MSVEEAAQRSFEDTHRLWIKPELDRRWGESGPPPDFRIRRCLILLPTGQPPIVQFNDEVHWLAEVRTVDDKPMVPGEVVFLHEVAQVKTVLPPEVDGKRLAFLFLYWSGHAYTLLFDCTPNWAAAEKPVLSEDWMLGQHLVDYLQSQLIEGAVNMPPTVINELKADRAVACARASASSTQYHFQTAGRGERRRCTGITR